MRYCQLPTLVVDTAPYRGLTHDLQAGALGRNAELLRRVIMAALSPTNRPEAS